MGAGSFDTLWRSGELVPASEATLPIRHLGQALVVAVHEGINAYVGDGRSQPLVFRLDDHLRRLAESTALAHLAPRFSAEELAAATLALLRHTGAREDVHIRISTFPAAIPTAGMVPRDARTETIIDVWPFRSALSESRTKTAAVTSWRRIGPNVMPPRVKAYANYYNGRLGNLDAEDRGADWPIFLNDQDHVCESSSATVGLFRGGVFYTPGLDCGILAGITRATVMELLPAALRIVAREARLVRHDLHIADEVLLLGTSAEVQAIVRIDGRRVGDGSIGPLTARLRDEYHAVVRGQRPERESWLTPA